MRRSNFFTHVLILIGIRWQNYNLELVDNFQNILFRYSKLQRIYGEIVLSREKRPESWNSRSTIHLSREMPRAGRNAFKFSIDSLFNFHGESCSSPLHLLLFISNMFRNTSAKRSLHNFNSLYFSEDISERCFFDLSNVLEASPSPYGDLREGERERKEGEGKRWPSHILWRVTWHWVLIRPSWHALPRHWPPASPSRHVTSQTSLVSLRPAPPAPLVVLAPGGREAGGRPVEEPESSHTPPHCHLGVSSSLRELFM